MPVKQTDLLLVYGLKNCDACSKARSWLDGHGVEFEFRDVRADGVEKDQLKRWLESDLGTLLINRRSTTWRGLNANEKALSETDPYKLLSKNPTLLKRPILERHGRLLAVGFSADEYRQHILS